MHVLTPPCGCTHVRTHTRYNHLPSICLILPSSCLFAAVDRRACVLDQRRWTQGGGGAGARVGDSPRARAGGSSGFEDKLAPTGRRQMAWRLTWVILLIALAVQSRQGSAKWADRASLWQYASRDGPRGDDATLASWWRWENFYDNDDVISNYNRARTTVSSNDAAYFYERAIDVDSTHGGAWNNLGLIPPTKLKLLEAGTLLNYTTCSDSFLKGL